MSTVSSSSAPRFGLPPRTWKFIAAAFGLGLLLGGLLLLTVWLDQRNDREFYRVEGAQDAAPGQVFEPLPTPQPDGDGRSASGLSEATEALARNPRPAPPPVTTVPTAPVPGEQPGPGVAPAEPAPEPVAADVPEPLQRTPPRYPSEALRRGETGTAIVRVDVDEEGRVDAVTLVSRTGSRALDRAAMQAVREWRFRPAQRDGRPVPGSVDVPIEFSLEGR
jgi:protein TonB